MASCTAEKTVQEVVGLDDVQITEQADKDAARQKKYYCGAGPCHPKGLQVFANTKFFTTILCVFALTETALISGFQPVVISNLERRYRFSSLAASLIVSVFDIAVVFCGIFVSYFGEKGHKPKILGVSFIIQGIGSLLFALPHFIFGRYEAGSNVQVLFESCNDTASALSDCDAGNSIAYAIFIIANAIMGIGATSLFTIGFSYIDDIVHPKWVSFHVGAFQICTIIGPAIGFGLGSGLITIYVDPSEPTTLTEEDPGWVGAWWLCFIIAGVVSLAGSIPFFFFPRLLDDSHLVREERLEQMARKYNGKFGKETTFLKQVKAFPYHLLGLFRSPSWFFMVVGVTVLFLGLDGLISFAPKYLETVYQVPASTAGLIIGAMAILAGATGALTGALLVYFVKIGKRMAIILWVASFLALIPLHGFFFVCPNVDIAGISTNYFNNSMQDPEDVLLTTCNADCNCSSTIFEPVCGADGVSYFSPCRASCLKLATDDPSSPDFVGCGCLGDNLPLSNRTALSGVCEQDCNLLAGFVVSVTMFVFLIFVLEVPTLLVTIRLFFLQLSLNRTSSGATGTILLGANYLVFRTIADEQRSLALGVSSVLFRVFGSIPGPILFGAIVDSGCVYWQLECGRRANCWVYDNYLLSTRAYAFVFICVLICGISTFLVWIFYPPVGCNGQGVETEEGEMGKPQKAESETKSDTDVAVYSTNGTFEIEQSKL